MGESVKSLALAIKDAMIKQGVFMQKEEWGGRIYIQASGYVDFETLAMEVIELLDKKREELENA